MDLEEEEEEAVSVVLPEERGRGGKRRDGWEGERRFIEFIQTAVHVMKPLSTPSTEHTTSSTGGPLFSEIMRFYECGRLSGGANLWGSGLERSSLILHCCWSRTFPSGTGTPS